MPILEVENAKMVIVNKRSMKPGYAGNRKPIILPAKNVYVIRRRKTCTATIDR
jgi:NAD/NADP transhydrogenase beta subunit